MSLNLGSWRSWRYSSVPPESGSNTGHANSSDGVHHNPSKCGGYLRLAALAGEICHPRDNKAASAVVVACVQDLVLLAIGEDSLGV